LYKLGETLLNPHEAYNYAYFVTNRSPCKMIDFMVLKELWMGKPVDYSVLKIFDCPAYIHVQSEEQSKLNLKSRKCIVFVWRLMLKAIGYGIRFKEEKC
jgi:hypothetical protein